MIDMEVLEPAMANQLAELRSKPRRTLLVSAQGNSNVAFLHPICSALRELISSKAEEQAELRMLVTNRTRQVTVGSHVELARTTSQRRRGLLGRSWLSRGGGLWISPCQAIHTACMQFPIDLVYLDRENRVRKVRSHVAPWRISLCVSAHSVLELPAGTNEVTGTSPGDLLEFCCAVPVA